MNEKNKRKANKKKQQSIFEKELMSYLMACARVCVKQALDDLFKEFEQM